MSSQEDKLLEFKKMAQAGATPEQLCLLAIQKRLSIMEQYEVMSFCGNLSFEKAKEINLKLRGIENLDDYARKILSDLDEALSRANI